MVKIPKERKRIEKSKNDPDSGYCLHLGFATLFAYMKIGYEHQANYGERYIPQQQRYNMQIKYTDALIIGGGLAGLRSAIATREKGLNTIVLSLVPVKRSHSAAAQGGMQASLGNSIMGEGDNEDVHFADTVKGSDWGCDQEVARMFVNTAPKAIRELASWGVPWNRVKKGDRSVVINAEHTTITEKEEAHGLINARDFGGTKKWRTCYTCRCYRSHYALCCSQ